jgi:hypothetical protein
MYVIYRQLIWKYFNDKTIRVESSADNRSQIDMMELAALAFTTYFATIGPVGVSAMFAALTISADARARRSMAIRGTIIAGVILLGFALVGEYLLSGLGISLVKHIVDAHGGRITVESRPGEGSRFAIHLPLGNDGQESEGRVT